jgi:hypothetical protein
VVERWLSTKSSGAGSESGGGMEWSIITAEATDASIKILCCIPLGEDVSKRRLHCDQHTSLAIAMAPSLFVSLTVDVRVRVFHSDAPGQTALPR